MTQDRAMPFEWKGWRKHVEFLLQRGLTDDEIERAKDMFFDKECPTYAAHAIHYKPEKK